MSKDKGGECKRADDTTPVYITWWQVRMDLLCHPHLVLIDTSITSSCLAHLTSSKAAVPRICGRPRPTGGPTPSPLIHHEQRSTGTGSAPPKPAVDVLGGPARGDDPEGDQRAEVVRTDVWGEVER